MIRSLTYIILLLSITLQGLAQMPVTGFRTQDYQSPLPYGYGGERQVQAFIDREMVYPQSAIYQGKEGTVAIFFITDTNGTTHDVKIANSVSPAVDAEALRLFHKLQWHPAMKWGQSRGCEHIYRIKFDIKKYKKACKKRGYEDIAYPYQPIDSTNAIYHFSKVGMMPKIMANKMVVPLDRYISDNLNYPDEAYAKNITGKVVLEYVVEPSGNISNIRAVEHLGGGCTDEAARLISTARWIPGINQGKAVRTLMLTEISFGLPAQAGPNSYAH